MSHESGSAVRALPAVIVRPDRRPCWLTRMFCACVCVRIPFEAETVVSWAISFDLDALVPAIRMRGAGRLRKAQRFSWWWALQSRSLQLHGGMATHNTEVLISEVRARHVLCREDHANFRRKNFTKKPWDEVASACDMTNGRLFKNTKTNRMVFISSEVVTEITYCC